MCCRRGGVVVRRYVTVFQSGTAEHEFWAPDVFEHYFSFYFRQFGHCHSLAMAIDTTLCGAGLFVPLEALLYIQQPSSGSKASLFSLMMVTDVERPSLPQSAS